MQVLIILAISLLVATIVFFVALAAERRTATDASEQTLGPHVAHFPGPLSPWASPAVPVLGVTLLILCALSFDYFKSLGSGETSASAAERVILERSIAELRANLAVMRSSCVPKSQYAGQMMGNKLDLRVCSQQVEEKSREMQRIINSLADTLH